MHDNGMKTFPYKVVHRLLAAGAMSAFAMMCSILPLAVAFSHSVFAADSVKVSDFGWDAVDSTRHVQAALDSGARRIVFDRVPGPWVVEPVEVRSNTDIVFEDGVELQAKRGAFLGRHDSLMSFRGVTNVTLVGMGAKGGTLRMHKLDYRKPPYEPSEFRHALSMAGAENILVENMSFVSSGGDGIEIHWLRGGSVACQNVVIRCCVCDDNHRQGISVISAENLLIEDCVLKNTSGTAPEAGIDFEPDWNPHRLVNCTMRRCRAEGNAGEGVKIHVVGLNGKAVPLGITVADTISRDNAMGACVVVSNPPGGDVVFTNCQFSGGGGAGAVSVRAKNADVPLVFADCTASQLQFLCEGWGDFVPDGVSLKNFTFKPEGDAEWFAQRRSLNPRVPVNVRGNVVVMRDGGKSEPISIDDEWCRRTFSIGADAMPPPRVRRLANGLVRRVRSAKAGEMVSMSPRGGGFAGRQFAFYVERPGDVHIRLRCVPKSATALEKERPKAGIMFGRGLYAPRAKPLLTLAAPDVTPQVYTVKVEKPGMHYLYEPRKNLPLVVEAADVPVAIDAQSGFCGQLVEGCASASLWLDIPPKTERFSVIAKSGTGCALANGIGLALAMDVRGPDGKVEWRDDAVKNKWTAFHSGAMPATGLWKIEVRPSEAGRPGLFTLDIAGVQGLLWLSPDKVAMAGEKDSDLHKFSVVNTFAGPRLAVDGVAQPAVAALPSPWVAPSNSVAAMRSFDKVGVKLFSNIWSMRYRPHEWWRGEGVYDWDAFDAIALGLVAASPEGWIMPRIKIEPPEWWLAAHPEEISSSGAEVKVDSKAWHGLYRRMLRDMLAHVEESSYASRVVGYHIGALHCGEWMDWKRPKSEMPLVPGEFASSPVAPHAATAARREYLNRRARCTADVLLDAAAIVKERTHGRKIVCAFFGYAHAIDHQDVMRVVKSGLVDIFAAPAYYYAFDGSSARGVGDPGVQQTFITASYALHGRVFFEEADPLTHLSDRSRLLKLSGALRATRPSDLGQSIGVVRRIIGKSLAQGTGLWWFLIGGQFVVRRPGHNGVGEMRRRRGETGDWRKASADDGRCGLHRRSAVCNQRRLPHKHDVRLPLAPLQGAAAAHWRCL